MAAFDQFIEALKTELVKFAKDSWKAYKASAVKDGMAFIEESKADLERWTKMLARGELTRDDFAWLMVGKKDLAELEALKQEGLAKVALDRFVNGLIDSIVTTAFKAFL
jgi:hypothetical protein